MMELEQIRTFVERAWRERAILTLSEYMRIPNQSPAYDSEWQAHGYMDQAVDLVAGWVHRQEVPGLTLEVVRLPGRTPLLFIEIPGESAETVLLYGHLDKQPPMEGWHGGLGAWTPVMRDGRLYGRGGADDGYATFAAVTAIGALKACGVPCARCVIIIEACEESGSFDLPHYIEALAERIGTPSLVVCLDSGCGNYEQLWVTTSLRGLLSGTLSVSVLTEGVHSGGAGGIVPSTFRILRELLSRLEDEKTGVIVPRALYVEVPDDRLRQMAETAETLGAAVYRSFPFQPGGEPMTRDVSELLLNRTWRPQLEVTGADGLPPIEKAGNVLRPNTAVKLSLRLPPTADAAVAAGVVKRLLERDPPHGATVRFSGLESASGWNAPPLTGWLEEAVERASRSFFGKPACFMGEGGTIPFMGMLGARFPAAQFMITGVLGPQSNAHGPNEFLDVSTAVRLTGCVASVLRDHLRATRDSGQGGIGI